MSVHERRILLLALVLATAIKVLLAIFSAGSDDLPLFFEFARGIRTEGICHLYGSEPIFNHTPLTSAFLSLLLCLSGAKYAAFGALLRLACVLADIALLLAVLRAAALQRDRAPLWALFLFVLSPVSILLSGFHGNIDPIMTLFFFLAALACMEDRAVLSAVFFGLACNVKIVPILFAPVFFFFWLHRGRGLRFAWIAAGSLLIGLAGPLFYCPAAYLRNVFGYGSNWGIWGFPYLLRETGIPAAQFIGFQHLPPFPLHVATLLKGVMVAGILLLGWRRRGVNGEACLSTLALCWSVFFVFAPGMGVQYLVWFAPFLLLHAVRSYAVLTLLSTASLLAFYQFYVARTPQFPWLDVHVSGVDSVAWCQCNFLLWLAFAGVGLFAKKLERMMPTP